MVLIFVGCRCHPCLVAMVMLVLAIVIVIVIACVAVVVVIIVRITVVIVIVVVVILLQQYRHGYCSHRRHARCRYGHENNTVSLLQKLPLACGCHCHYGHYNDNNSKRAIA